MTCIGVALITRRKLRYILKLCKEQNHLGTALCGWNEEGKRMENFLGKKAPLFSPCWFFSILSLWIRAVFMFFFLICVVVETCEKTCYFFRIRSNSAVQWPLSQICLRDTPNRAEPCGLSCQPKPFYHFCMQRASSCEAICWTRLCYCLTEKKTNVPYYP